MSPTPFPGIDGFLGTRASLMLDVVFLAMFAVLPLLGWSIYQVRCRQRYLLHKRVQLLLGSVLALAVTLFEIDMRANGWTERAGVPPGQAVPVVLQAALWVHLVFAVSTAVLWVYVIVQAWRKFPHPPLPSAYSQRHVFWARIAAADMVLTAVTGWAFYWLAFARELPAG